jgi:hypothetical protein
MSTNLVLGTYNIRGFMLRDIPLQIDNSQRPPPYSHTIELKSVQCRGNMTTKQSVGLLGGQHITLHKIKESCEKMACGQYEQFPQL